MRLNKAFITSIFLHLVGKLYVDKVHIGDNKVNVNLLKSWYGSLEAYILYFFNMLGFINFLLNKGKKRKNIKEYISPKVASMIERNIKKGTKWF